MKTKRRFVIPVLCIGILAGFGLFRDPSRAEQPANQYAPLVAALEPIIQREMASKGLPAISIALVDDQTTVWSKGFGFVDPKAKTPASANTIYRVGSVSKLFTDLGIMQLAEKGALDIDAPISKYVPEFQPKNPHSKPITLRQLMTHRAGLVREPPVGHYFDPTVPTLEQTVMSLNRTELVYAPEAKIKYSNAAIATVGYVLERTQKEPFPTYLKKAVLNPLGLTRSAFEPTPDVRKDLAKALMWSYHGRTFDAPTFELGMAPAGSMYSDVNELGKFLSVMFAKGKSPHGQVVKPETLDEMWKPQFAKPGDKGGFGLGFALSELDGKRRIGHGGAVYGFATELAFLPDEKLGVAVVCSKDVANPVMERIANFALRGMLAVRQGKGLPKLEESKPLDLETVRKLVGTYRSGEKAFDLMDHGGKLYVLPKRGGYRSELRALDGNFMVDDVVSVGQKFQRHGDNLIVNGETYVRQTDKKPEPAPNRWLGLIGEYGWDHNTLFILERDGKLHALIEWVFLYPLEEESANVFKFPNWGLYHDEKLIFHGDAKGHATEVEAASVVFKRRHLDGEDGRTFRIRPLRPIEELRKESIAAKPPSESGFLNKPDLVELVTLDPTIKLDIRYATDNNFLSTPVYATAKAFLQRPAAEALVRAHRKLKEHGYGLLIHDGYRPWYVTRIFWEATQEKNRIFVANPAQGSRHNRGMAVDLTLYDLKTGEPVQMVGGYDEMSDRSYPAYLGGTSLQRWHRELLRRAMEDEGFTVYEAEWWHFDFKDWKKYPILNLRFEELGK